MKPYFALRSYQDGGQHYSGQIGSEPTPAEFVDALLECTAEMVRVLKPSGSIFVNLGDKYATTMYANNVVRKVPQPDGEWNAVVRGGGTPNLQPIAHDPGGVRSKSLLGMPWRYALGCIDELGLILRAEIIWSKPNGLPESVTDRVRRSHEQWFHLVTQPRYFAAVDEIREPQSGSHAQGSRSNPSRLSGNGVKHRTFYGENENFNPLGKLPGSVREVPSSPLKVPAHLDVDHFAAFPPAWPAWLIRGWSPTGICTACDEARRPMVDKTSIPHWKGGSIGTDALRGDIDGMKFGNGAARFNYETTITGYECGCDTPWPLGSVQPATRAAVVFDPFGGTGTTAMAARALGRHGITVDLSTDYCRLAQWRCSDLDQLRAVRGIPKTDQPTVPGALTLFDGEAS